MISILLVSACMPEDELEVDASDPQLMAEQKLSAEMGPVDDTLRQIVELRTEFRAAPGIEVPKEAAEEAWELRYRFAHSLRRAMGPGALLARSGDAELVTVEYLGKGVVADPPAGEQPVVSSDEVPRIPATNFAYASPRSSAARSVSRGSSTG